MNIIEKIAAKSNDYSSKELEFKKIGRLVDENKLKAKVTGLSASIIIPIFNMADRVQLCLDSLAMQDFSVKNKLEIILIDDCSTEDVYSKLNFDPNLKIRYYLSAKNNGYGVPTNLGLILASNEITILMDSDMIAPPEFVSEHVARHAKTDKIILVGFKENIEIEDLKRIKLGADYKKDDRYCKETVRYEKDGSIIRAFDDTNKFKNFGNGMRLYSSSLPFGWSLAEMVVSHNISLRRSEAISIGGFDPALSGNWGYDDCYFGAKAIANDNFIVPCISAPCFHIKHPVRKGMDKKQKMRAFEINREIYLRKLEEEHRIWTEKEFYEANKKNLNGLRTLRT